MTTVKLRLAIVSLLAIVSSPSVAQLPATTHRGPVGSTTHRAPILPWNGDSANGVSLSGDGVHTENNKDFIEVILSGNARLVLRENNDEKLVIVGELLRVRSGELCLPKNPAAKRNLRVSANGNCVFVGKGIQCEGNELLLEEDSEAGSFSVTLNGGVTVSVGHVTLASEKTDVSLANGSYRIRGDFSVLSADGEPSHAAEPAVGAASNGEPSAPAR